MHQPGPNLGAQPGGPLRITHPGVLPPTRAHPSPGESKGRGRGPGDQHSFPGPPPPPISSRRGCRHGNAPSSGPARQAPSRCRPRRLPRPQQALRAVYGHGHGPRRLRRRPGRGRASSAAPHRPFPAASTAAASTTSAQHTDSPPRTLTPADATDGRTRWPTAEPATGSFNQWAAGGRGFFSPNAYSPADMRAKVCQDGDSQQLALWDL